MKHEVKARRIATQITGLDPDVIGPIDGWTNFQRQKFVAAESAAMLALTSSDALFEELKDEQRRAAEIFIRESTYTDNDGRIYRRPTAYEHAELRSRIDRWHTRAVEAEALLADTIAVLRTMSSWWFVQNRSYIVHNIRILERYLESILVKRRVDSNVDVINHEPVNKQED